MNRFQFSLETLLNVRIRKEEEVERKLALKNCEIEQQRIEIVNLQDQIKQFQREEKLRRSSGENVISMRHSVSYRNHLKLRLLKYGRVLDDLLEEAHFIRKKLVNASRERKSVEILKEKRFVEWKKKYHRFEQNSQDEVSTQGFIRKRSGSASL